MVISLELATKVGGGEAGGRGAGGRWRKVGGSKMKSRMRKKERHLLCHQEVSECVAQLWMCRKNWKAWFTLDAEALRIGDRYCSGRQCEPMWRFTPDARR